MASRNRMVFGALVLLGLFVAAGAVLVVGFAPIPLHAPTTSPEVVQSEPVAATEPEARNLGQALSRLRPYFAPGAAGIGFSDSGLALAQWMRRFPGWANANSVADNPRSALLEAMKDPASHLGNTLCVSGTVLEIHTDRSLGVTLDTGTLLVSKALIVERVKFISTGESQGVVNGTEVSLCGVFTSTDAGGAAEVVGVFALPENK